jgi:transcriptional regulator with XRE-family HTH domain
VFVAYPLYLKEKARKLRIDRGMTIDEIAERLALGRTTIYHWVCDLPIDRKPPSEWPQSAREAGTRAMQKKYRLLREAAYQHGVEEFDELDKDPGFREFVCMYIGEGYKRSRNRVAISNSDPAVMRLATWWLKRLTCRQLAFSIQFHADQNLEALRQFWSAELGIDPACIRFQRKSNSSQLNGRTWRSRYGVLTIACGDTYLRARLQAWIDHLEARWRQLELDADGA